MKRARHKQALHCFLYLMVAAAMSLPECVDGRKPAAIEVRVFHSFAQNIVVLMLPMIFAGVSSEGGDISLSLVDTVYCGNDARHGTAKFLGIVYPGEAPQDKVVSMIGEEDCRGSRTATLKRIMASPATPYWTGLVELDAKWTPWQLEFIPTKLHALAKSQHPRVEFRLARDATKAYHTSSMSIPAGNGKTVPLHIALGVGGKAFLFDALVENKPPAHYAPTFTEPIGEDVPSGTNAIVSIPHAVANTVFTEYLPGETFPIQLVDRVPALTIKNPVFKRNRDTYMTTSVLGVGEYPDAFNLEVQWSGEDLRLRRLSLTARRTMCGSDVMCQVQKAGWEALATSLTRLLSAQYKDVSLRSMILQDVMSVKLNDRDIHVRMEVLRAEATSTDLVLYTKLKLTLPQSPGQAP
jgi:hypothetical protein